MTGIELARILLEHPDKDVAMYSGIIGRNMVICTAEYAEDVDQIILV